MTVYLILTRKPVPAETVWARSKHAQIIMYNTVEDVAMHKSVKQVKHQWKINTNANKANANNINANNSNYKNVNAKM